MIVLEAYNYRHVVTLNLGQWAQIILSSRKKKKGEKEYSKKLISKDLKGTA